MRDPSGRLEQAARARDERVALAWLEAKVTSREVV
jgi:hypothetical protein